MEMVRQYKTVRLWRGVLIKMAWEKLGSTTLGSAGDTITVSGFTAKTFNQFLCHSLQVTSNVRMALQVNGDTATNYANRDSENGGGDTTATSQTFHKQSGADTYDGFSVTYGINISAQEKLFITHQVGSGGQGNAPTRMESVAKWANTSNQYTSGVETNNQAGDFNTGSNLTIFGTD